MADAPEPTVEIAVPYVGSERLLREAVESVLAQRDPRWSLLVLVDGPGEPRVEEWLDAYADPRIRHARNDERLGIPGSFQRCLELGDSSHVTFLGCDDRLLPNYVRVVREALRAHPVAAAVHPEVVVVDDSDLESRPIADRVKHALAPATGRDVLAGEALLRSLMLGNWTYFPATCWDRRRVAAHGFRQDLPVTLDLALWADVVLAGGELVLVRERAAVYRRHAGSVSSATRTDVSRFVEERRVHRQIADDCRRRGWRSAARAARMRPSARLHALISIPAVVRSGNRGQLGKLAGAVLR